MKTRDYYDDYESPRPAPRRKPGASTDEKVVRKRADAPAPAAKKPAAKKTSSTTGTKPRTGTTAAKPASRTVAKKSTAARTTEPVKRRSAPKPKPVQEPFKGVRSTARDYAREDRYQSEWDDYDEEYELKEYKVKKSARKATRTKPMTAILWWVVAIAIAFAVSFLINHYLFEVVSVTSDSMHETLMRGDLVLVSKFDFKEDGPTQGEIIAARRGVQSGTLLRRVIAVPGQTIEIDGEQTLINGVQLNEMQYKSLENYDVFPAKTLPEGKYYLMGDNRSEVSDSRSDQIGLVDKNEIVGRVRAVIWPLNHWSTF